MLESRNSRLWLTYIFIPVSILFRVLFITIWMNIGTIFVNYKIGFQKLFTISLISFVVFALGEAIFTLLVSFIEINTVYQTSVFKLSLLELFGIENVNKWLVFPLRSINIYEVIYMYVFGVLLSSQLKLPKRTAITFTLVVYGLGLITWSLFVLFIYINIY